MSQRARYVFRPTETASFVSPSINAANRGLNMLLSGELEGFFLHGKLFAVAPLQKKINSNNKILRKLEEHVTIKDSTQHRPHDSSAAPVHSRNWSNSRAMTSESPCCSSRGAL